MNTIKFHDNSKKKKKDNEDFKIIPVPVIYDDDNKTSVPLTDDTEDKIDDKSGLIKRRKLRELRNQEKIHKKNHRQRNDDNDDDSDYDFILRFIIIIFLLSIFLISAYHYFIYRYIYILFLIMIIFLPNYTDNIMNYSLRITKNSYKFIRKISSKFKKYMTNQNPK